VAKRQFGASSDLYRGRRLQREHLIEIAAHRFEAVEVRAADGHFDPAQPAAAADLLQWLAEARLALSGIAVACAAESPAGAIARALDALYVARRIPMKTLIVEIGAPREASRLVERLAEAAEPLGVIVAVDSRSASMAAIGSLAHFVERSECAVGVALDVAGAARGGGLVDAIELVSEHLAAVRVPVDAAIDWSAPMTTLQKVGYEGALIFDAPGGGKPALARAVKTREKMERWLTSI
jgi:sugar phosphate isomerase/epimerase